MVVVGEGDVGQGAGSARDRGKFEGGLKDGEYNRALEGHSEREEG